MSEATDKIEKWFKDASEYNLSTWDRLPEIYLYMDQVLTYMNKQLTPYEGSRTSGQLTSSMINNYVKDGVLERPKQKKYAREHLAVLTVICMLKSVLSIQEISTMLNIMAETQEKEALYEKFIKAHTTAFQEVGQRVLDTINDGEAALNLLAVELSIEANARRSAAEKILNELSETRTVQKKKE